jgi:hypothetical protein
MLPQWRSPADEKTGHCASGWVIRQTPDEHPIATV